MSDLSSTLHHDGPCNHPGEDCDRFEAKWGPFAVGPTVPCPDPSAHGSAWTEVVTALSRRCDCCRALLDTEGRCPAAPQLGRHGCPACNSEGRRA